jgi:general secretion pathway protein K
VALIIVTLVVTLAASMVWQQWRAVQVEAAERARTQSQWILQGALDWARLILREDARSGRPTALTEPWATPLAEARLSTFLAADKDNNAEDGPEAFLSGSITDAQARFNLANLLDPSGKVLQADLEALERLCQTVGVSESVASRIATGLRDAQAAGGTQGSGTAPLRPRSLAQLTWLGIDAATIASLEPYVTLLPKRTPINANTAPREVLAAVIKDLDLATAERLVQMRQREPFKTLGAVEAQIPGLGPLNNQQVSVLSSFFEVRGRLRLDDRVLEQRSLVEREGLDMKVLQREQVSTVESLRS